MGRKQVAIATKVSADSVDSWVATPRTEAEPVTPVVQKREKMKRLTLDIPETLHKAIKARSVEKGVAMVDMLREDLAKKYGNTEAQK